MPHLLDKKNVKMLTEQKVFSETELRSRMEIMLDNYNKTVLIEAATMVDMVRKQILPAVEEYSYEVASTAGKKTAVVADLACGYEKKLISKLSVLTDQIEMKTEELEDAILKTRDASDVVEESYGIRDNILTKMSELRAVCDEAETVTAEKYWPFPTYGELLFGVR